jgi:Domain of unknown function (DUF5925)/ATPase family associated with various cellular activities (AAA)
VAGDDTGRSERLRLTAVHDVAHDELAAAVFNARVLDEGLSVLRGDSWPTQAKSIELGGDRVFVTTTRWGRRELVRLDDGLVDVNLYSGQVSVSVAARSEDAAASALDRLRELLPAPDPSGAQEVTVTFWTYGPNGPMPAWRTISVPAWTDIQENYAAETHASLAALMDGFQPAHGGQLVLWHGGVGTGKTFALRALAWEWRDWCDIHYIVDPDSFFGQHADYLMHVLLQSEWEGQFATFSMGGAVQTMRAVGLGVSEPEISEESEEERKGKSWRLLVLEDTGELLQPDAKAIIGQGLSRFLNVVDGLIGQGLRVLVLVTTNEEIRKLHPAVARPGRSAANVRFDPLGAEQASAWLESHGARDSASSATTIAELFARLEGRDAPKRSVGFDDS